ncbi:MAG TPA: type II CAAX endopeptidase family protein [Gaiellaceae bacterium]
MRSAQGRLIGWLVLVGALIAIGYSSRYIGEGETDREVLYRYSTAAAGIVQFALVLGIVLFLASADLRGLLALRRPRSLGQAAGLALTVLVGIIVVSTIVSFLPLPESPGQEQGLTPTHWEPQHAGAFAANAIVVVVFAPITEELTFRGLGYSVLEPFGQTAAILLVGLAFGLAHGLVEGLLVLVPFGIGLAWLRSRTESVYPGMVLHGVFNAVALAIAVT